MNDDETSEGGEETEIWFGQPIPKDHEHQWAKSNFGGFYCVGCGVKDFSPHPEAD